MCQCWESEVDIDETLIPRALVEFVFADAETRHMVAESGKRRVVGNDFVGVSATGEGSNQLDVIKAVRIFPIGVEQCRRKS